MPIPRELTGRLDPASGPFGTGPGGEAQALASTRRPLELTARLVIDGTGSAIAQLGPVTMNGPWVLDRCTVMSDNPPNVARLYLFRSVTFDIAKLIDWTACPDVNVAEWVPPIILQPNTPLSAWVIGAPGAQYALTITGWQA